MSATLVTALRAAGSVLSKVDASGPVGLLGFGWLGAASRRPLAAWQRIYRAGQLGPVADAERIRRTGVRY